MVGIYGIFRKSDNKCMYVGQSKDINGRIKAHLNGNTKNSFNKEEYYGDVIEEHMINNKQFRLEREAYWIDQLNPELNVIRDETNRGEYMHASEEKKKKLSESHKGKHPSEDTRKKIGAANSGEKSHFFGKPAWNRGMSFSEETRKKQSEAKLGENAPWFGKHLSEDHRQKIGESTKYRTWINNGVTNKRVKPDELHLYIENGWKLGRIK